MRVVLFMAMSLNGIIADEEGKEDFLSFLNWECFCKEAEKYRGFVIGRKTYEIVSKYFEGHGFDDLSGTKIIVSSNEKYKAPDGYEKAVSPRDAIKIAIERGLDTLLLTGGPTLNSHFLNEELVDEVWLNIEPTLIGSGKNLVTPILKECRLTFVDCVKIGNNIVQIHYNVSKKNDNQLSGKK